MQWEYLVLHVTYAGSVADTKMVVDGDNARVSAQGLSAAMNQLGADEWEAFGVVAEAQGAFKHIVFKRPYAQQTEQQL